MFVLLIFKFILILYFYFLNKFLSGLFVFPLLTNITIYILVSLLLVRFFRIFSFFLKIHNIVDKMMGSISFIRLCFAWYMYEIKPPLRGPPAHFVKYEIPKDDLHFGNLLKATGNEEFLNKVFLYSEKVTDWKNNTYTNFLLTGKEKCALAHEVKIHLLEYYEITGFLYPIVSPILYFLNHSILVYTEYLWEYIPRFLCLDLPAVLVLTAFVGALIGRDPMDAKTWFEHYDDFKKSRATAKRTGPDVSYPIVFVNASGNLYNNSNSKNFLSCEVRSDLSKITSYSNLILNLVMFLFGII